MRKQTILVFAIGLLTSFVVNATEPYSYTKKTSQNRYVGFVEYPKTNGELKREQEVEQLKTMKHDTSNMV